MKLHRGEVLYYPGDEREPDKLGRRMWIAEWLDPSYYRPETGPDGKPVGFRRGQVFYATEEWIKAGWPGMRVLRVDPATHDTKRSRRSRTSSRSSSDERR